MEGGADPNIGKSSVFFTAAMRGHTGAIEAFLDAGKVDIHSRNLGGLTTLMLAVEYGNPDTARLLANRGSNVNAQDNDGKTPLIFAIDKGDIALVDLLLQLGADANQKDAEGKTALHRSIAKGNLEIVSKILSKTTDLNATDNGWNAPCG